MRSLFHRVDLLYAGAVQYHPCGKNDKVHHQVGKEHAAVHVGLHVIQHSFIDKDPFLFMLDILSLHCSLPEEQVRRDSRSQDSDENT
jgi:hypothetical protein